MDGVHAANEFTAPLEIANAGNEVSTIVETAIVLSTIRANALRVLATFGMRTPFKTTIVNNREATVTTITG